jgi:hypothetical protein
MLKKLVYYSCSVAIGLGCVPALTMPDAASAQQNAGIILWGSAKDKALDYVLDYGRANQIDRYYLEIPAQKVAVSEILVTYPASYNGEFDPDSMDLRVNNKNVKVQSTKWDKDSRIIEVVLQEPVPANKAMKLVLSNVRNPRFGGLFQFDARVRGSNDLPMMRYIGSWIIGLE